MQYFSTAAAYYQKTRLIGDYDVIKQTTMHMNKNFSKTSRNHFHSHFKLVLKVQKILNIEEILIKTDRKLSKMEILNKGRPAYVNEQLRPSNTSVFSFLFKRDYG